MIKGFDIDLYNCFVTFVWDSSEMELTTFFNENPQIPKKYKDEMITIFRKRNCDAFTGPLSHSDVITIFMSDTSHRTVAHEIYHLCHLIMTKRGIKDEEAWAYLIGYITEKYYELKDEKNEVKEQTTDSYREL